MPTDALLSPFADALCDVAATLAARGLVHADLGSLTLRLDAGAGWLASPAGARLEALRPDALVRLDGANTSTTIASPGATAPHADLALHQRTLAAATVFDAATACVLFAPAVHCVALTLEVSVGRRAELLPALTPDFVLRVGHVPVIPYFGPGDARCEERVAAAIAQHGAQGTVVRAVALERRGVLAWGATPHAALAVLEVLEHTARLWHMTFPRPQPLEPWETELLASGPLTALRGG